MSLSGRRDPSLGASMRRGLPSASQVPARGTAHILSLPLVFVNFALRRCRWHVKYPVELTRDLSD
jgi:hypothetical protein